MTSLSARLAVSYAIAATATLAVLSIAGYFMLHDQMLHQLDQLNETQFKQLRTALGPNYKTLTPQVINERIRDTTESASTLFYIDMHGPMTNRFFKSNNLHGQSIPDIPGERAYSTEVPGVAGMLRVSEFLLPPFEVTVATPLAPVDDVMNGYLRVSLALIILMLLVSIALGFGLAQIVLRPIRVIRDTANRIRSDNLRERIPVHGVKDEITELARLLNQMFDRLEHSFGQIRRFTADASHELKTPLSLVRLHAERVLMNASLDPGQRESLHVQLEELARVNQIIDELLFISRADAQSIAIQAQQQSPVGFLHSFAQDAAALAEHHGCRFTYTHEGEGEVAFEEKRMRQVLLNLLANALNVSPGGASITLQSKLDEGVWRVAVCDEGPGLNPEQRVQMFERFVRFGVPSASDKGSGLGLAICRSIVQLHKGRIFALEGESGRGLQMVFEIPRAA
jgi:two-component system heavy metal sensor histidine kinase CusS